MLNFKQVSSCGSAHPDWHKSVTQQRGHLQGRGAGVWLAVLSAGFYLSLLSEGKGCSRPGEELLVLLRNQPSGLRVELRTVGAC